MTCPPPPGEPEPPPHSWAGRLLPSVDWPISRLLTFFALGLVVPLQVLTGIALVNLDHAERARYEERAVAVASQSAGAVDRELGNMLASLEALATSNILASGNDNEIYERAHRAARLLASNLIVFDAASGRQVLNTGVPLGTTLPLGVDTVALLAATSLMPRVSGLATGQISRTPVFGVYVPVIRNGAAVAVIASSYDPIRIARVLTISVGSPHWIATAIDQDGRVVARSIDHERFVGVMEEPAVLGPINAGRPNVVHALSLNGAPSLVAMSALPRAGWRVIVLFPLAQIEASIQSTWLWFSVGSVLALLLSVTVALLIGRHIAGTVGRLAFDARRLGEGEIPAVLRSNLREANLVSVALHHAGQLRRQREEDISMLLREVNHRSKNLLAVVQAIATRTARGPREDFLARFTDRVGALIASQDLLIESNWQGVDLAELVRAELGGFKDLFGGRIVIAGPKVRLSAVAAQTIGMAVHELGTNAAKYGALSVPEGEVRIDWRLEATAAHLRLTWIEQGGPAVARPSRRGFGSTVILDAPRLGLRAEVTLEHRRGGTEWRLVAPLANVLDGPGYRAGG